MFVLVYTMRTYLTRSFVLIRPASIARRFSVKHLVLFVLVNASLMWTHVASVDDNRQRRNTQCFNFDSV